MITDHAVHGIPCHPWRLHVHQLRSPPRPSSAFKPVLTSTDMSGSDNCKQIRSEILSKDHRNLVSAYGGSTRSSDAAPSFRPQQEQQWSLGQTAPTKLSFRDRGAEHSSLKLLKPSRHAQRNQGHITVPSAPHVPISEVGQVGKAPMGDSSPSETNILSPHAIQKDLIEPRATWYHLPQTEDRNNDYIHEPALKPRRSIADKLSSMVERGWVGGDTFGKIYSDNEFESHTTEPEVHIRDTRPDSKSDSLNETPRLKKVPSYSELLSVSTAETRSKSQHSSGRDTVPHVKQKEPRFFMYHGSQKRRQRQEKRSPAVNRAQRSSSDDAAHYLKTEYATPTRNRRAWTLHHLGRCTSNHSQIQREVSPTVWPPYARDHRSNEQDHESTKTPPSHEGSTTQSGFELSMLRDEQLHHDSAAPSKVTGLRRSSSNTKESTRSAMRSTSFFKKFPWYKVALVDKQPVGQDLSKVGRGKDRTSKSTPAPQYDPTLEPFGLSRGVSRSHTLVRCGSKEDEDTLKTKNPPNPGPIDQRAMDAIKSCREVSSQSSLQLVTSPQEVNEDQGLERIQRVPERPQDPPTPSSQMTEERQLRYPHQVIENVIGHEPSPPRTGSSGTQPRVLSQSESMAASFESPLAGDVLQSLQPQSSERKEQSGMQSNTSSYADSTKLHVDVGPKQRPSGPGTTRPEQESTSSPNPFHQHRSKVVNLSPKCLGTSTDSSVHRSSQHGPMRREIDARGKGIKRIQVIVTFDGTEDLVVEATLKKDGQEHWRAMA